MRLLLDTHVWLWWNTEPERLSSAARRQIADTRNEVYLSAASVWEISIKQKLGKLPLLEPVSSYIARRLAADDIRPLSISVDHAAGVENLQPLHKDPFDRILIAQARHDGLRLLTADEQVLGYGSPTVDVRIEKKR